MLGINRLKGITQVLFVSSMFVLLSACEQAVTSAPDASASSIAVLAEGEHRSEKNRARNRYRHPEQTLKFFDIKPTMSVIEISPGGLWYTEILAPFLKDQGRYIAAGYDVALADQPSYRYRLTQAMVDRFEQQADLFAKAEVIGFSPPQSMYLGADDSVDRVLTFRNTHGWVRSGVAVQVYQAFYDVLKPGGVLGVVQHRGDTSSLASGGMSGYLTEAVVIDIAEQAGFILEARSDINANANDTADHPQGVWTLPPTLRQKELDKARYLAIGESDRMTLRFKKKVP
ncbi:MAG: methyltransferase [Pseudomonadales bacterium]|nr:methyltransferase [Pseudomonadales bacterium]